MPFLLTAASQLSLSWTVGGGSQQIDLPTAKSQEWGGRDKLNLWACQMSVTSSEQQCCNDYLSERKMNSFLFLLMAETDTPKIVHQLTPWKTILLPRFSDIHSFTFILYKSLLILFFNRRCQSCEAIGQSRNEEWFLEWRDTWGTNLRLSSLYGVSNV